MAQLKSRKKIKSGKIVEPVMEGGDIKSITRSIKIYKENNLEKI